jgi:hypothetical protein
VALYHTHKAYSIWRKPYFGKFIPLHFYPIPLLFQSIFYGFISLYHMVLPLGFLPAIGFRGYFDRAAVFRRRTNGNINLLAAVNDASRRLRRWPFTKAIIDRCCAFRFSVPVGTRNVPEVIDACSGVEQGTDFYDHGCLRHTGALRASPQPVFSFFYSYTRYPN